jgi:SAM-dependent methyltransferase
VAIGELAQARGLDPYTFKTGPYSSHTLLLQALPAEGRGRRVLDVGCAGGFIGGALARRGYTVTGIDLPGPPPEGFPREVERIERDLEDGLPPLAGRFPFVLCADVLEHVRRPERLLAEVSGVLDENGVLIASLPNSGHAFFRLNVLLGRFPAEDRGLFDRTHLHFYMWKGWVDLFASAGFRIETVQPTGVPVGLALPRWSGSPPVRAMEWLSFVAARAWKKLFAYQFVVTARR